MSETPQQGDNDKTRQTQQEAEDQPTPQPKKKEPASRKVWIFRDWADF